MASGAPASFFARGIFPAAFAWFLEGPWRRLVLSPATLRARLPLGAHATVCEIGVGGGYYGRALARDAARYVAVDIQLGMLARVRRHEGGDALLLVQGDAMHIPLASDSIDVVVAVTVLGEVPSAAAAMQEFARILRPGGVLSVSEHIPDPDYIRFDTLTALCSTTGLMLEERHGPSWSYTATFRKPGAQESAA